MLKLFGYPKCSTCRKAQKFLEENELDYKYIDITETPPSKATFKKILSQGDYSIKDLFNRSGVMYREMNMKDKMKDMGEGELVELLAQHGKLVKRPIVTDGEAFTVGYRDNLFNEMWT